MLCPQQQSVKEDVFPDAEGWENVDPDEAAKWSVGSEFATGKLEQSQKEGGAAAEIPPGEYHQDVLEVAHKQTVKIYTLSLLYSVSTVYLIYPSKQKFL